MKKPKVLDRHSDVSVKLTTHRPREVDADGRLAIKTPVGSRSSTRALNVIVPRKRAKNHRGLVQSSEG